MYFACEKNCEFGGWGQGQNVIDQMFISPHPANSYAETLAPNVMTLRAEVFRRKLRFDEIMRAEFS